LEAALLLGQKEEKNFSMLVGNGGIFTRLALLWFGLFKTG
jgi:hypothetical protein